MKIYMVVKLLILALKYIFFFIIAIIALILLLVLSGLLLLNKENTRVEELKKEYSDAKEKCLVKLISVGNEKIKIIRILREYIDWDLGTAKMKVESELPVVVSYSMPLNLAKELEAKFKDLDTIIEIYEI